MSKISGKYKYHFSDRLKEQLYRISDYPLTVVEAPSGFGKTTAVREYLKKELSGAACEWYICLGEPASAAWMGICELFSNVDRKATDELKNLKMPVMDTLSCVTAILRSLSCQKETYLVIDNYQLINCNIQRELISAFSIHGKPNLHMIFITQKLEVRRRFFVHNNDIYTIDSSTFFFDREGIVSLFRMEGLRLTQSELERIFMCTEGWISAIRLQMINFKETGSFVYSAGIEQLVETAVWNRLAPIEQDFLLKVSVFDSFTARQAAAMLEYDITPDKIERDLRTNDFIRYFPEKHSFIIHSILLDYLRSRFYHYQTEEYQKQVFHKAGTACADVKQYCSAAGFFYKVGDFEAILSLPFTRKYLDEQKEKCEGELLAAIIKECPEETLCKYPFAMLTFGYYAFLTGQYDIYIKQCRLLRSLVQRKTNFAQEEIRKINGERILLETPGEFNDISKMQEGYRTAWEILGGQSDMIENGIPWLSVSPSVFGMFWREAGFSYVMQAEVMLVRGEDEEAEILCHKALYEARGYRQTSICLYAELTLARVFILRGEEGNFSASVRNIQEYAKENPSLSIQRMIDLCMSIISLLLGTRDYIATWIYNMESIKKFLNAHVVPFAQILYLRLLLMDKRYSELYAVSQIALEALGNPDGNIKYLMPKLYYLIFLAVAKHNNGNDVEAQRYLKEALNIALPDQIYLPFADHECMADLLAGLSMCSLDFANNAGASGNISPSHLAVTVNGVQHSGGLSVLADLCKRQARGVSIIKKAIQQNKSPLTPREREVAHLAKDRISSREIADKLYISEATVKTILRSVYSKLDIHSRSELASKEF